MHVIAELPRHNRLKQFRRRNLETASDDRTFLTPAGGVLGTMKTREWKKRRVGVEKQDQISAATLSGNSLRQTVHTHSAFVH